MVTLADAEEILDRVGEKARKGEHLSDVELALRHFAGKYYRQRIIIAKLKLEA